jgi:hypothetical protein
MPSQAKSPDSARPLWHVQNARQRSLGRASCTMFRIRRGSERTSGGVRRIATGLPSLGSHSPADGCWRGICGVFDSGRCGLIARGRSSRSARGTREAKEYTENLVVNTLPSKRKKNYVTIMLAVSCQWHLDWRRRARCHSHYRCRGAIASRLTAEPLLHEDNRRHSQYEQTYTSTQR